MILVPMTVMNLQVPQQQTNLLNSWTTNEWLWHTEGVATKGSSFSTQKEEIINTKCLWIDFKERDNLEEQRRCGKSSHGKPKIYKGW